MKKLHFTGQFKKDLKRYRNQTEKLELLYHVLEYLERGEKIPDEYFPHKLHHDYKGCWECHVQDDFLLIWMHGNVVDIVRLGSHSELYGKGKKK